MSAPGWFLGMPERWMDGVVRFACAQGHVSRHVILAETRGDLCPACGGPVRMVPPETPEGEIAQAVYLAREAGWPTEPGKVVVSVSVSMDEEKLDTYVRELYDGEPDDPAPHEPRPGIGMVRGWAEEWAQRTEQRQSYDTMWFEATNEYVDATRVAVFVTSDPAEPAPVVPG